MKVVHEMVATFNQHLPLNIFDSIMIAGGCYLALMDCLRRQDGPVDFEEFLDEVYEQSADSDMQTLLMAAHVIFCQKPKAKGKRKPK